MGKRPLSRNVRKSDTKIPGTSPLSGSAPKTCTGSSPVRSPSSHQEGLLLVPRVFLLRGFMYLITLQLGYWLLCRLHASSEPK